MKPFYTILVCLLGVGVGYYLYDRYFKKSLFSVPIRKFDKFTLEDLLSWFKQHEIIETMDCCVINDEETAKYGFNIEGISRSKDENVILLAIYEAPKKKVKDAIAIVYKELDADIKALLKDKKIVILE